MGMNPWDLDRYTVYEYVLRQRGYYKARKEQWQHDHTQMRLLAYYGIIYDTNLQLSIRRKKMDALVPDMFAPIPTEAEIDKLYEDKRAHAKRVTEKLKQRGKQPRNRR